MENPVPNWYLAAATEHIDQLYSGGTFVSSREAAKIVGVGKSAGATFMLWLRTNYLKVVTHIEEERVEEVPAVIESLSVSDKSKTWTDEKSKTVFTELGDYGLKIMSQGEFRAIKRDYSRHYGGHAVSRAEIALQYGFPTIKAFELFARIHELRQNGLPFTDTEILEDGVEALADKAIESQRQALYLKITEKEREAEKRDAEKWRTLDLSLQAVIARLAADQPLPGPAISSYAPHADHALMISLTDLHLGKRAQAADGTVIWDRKKAAQVALSAVNDLLSSAMDYGRAEEVMLLIASDGIQADNSLLTTTGGTSMAGQTDGTYREMVEDYLLMVKRAVEACRAVAPVRLLVVEGNHDRITSMMLGLMLQQIYSADPNVRVERQLDQGMVLVNYGANTLAFLHGEHLRGNKGAQLWPAISALSREKGAAVQPNILSFSGHLHHERTEDLGGIIHHILPALCPPDEYHRRGLWMGSREGAQAFVIRKSGGKSAVLYHQPGAA